MHNAITYHLMIDAQPIPKQRFPHKAFPKMYADYDIMQYRTSL